MALNKVTYVENETVIHAQNLNDIQDVIVELEEEASILKETINALEEEVDKYGNVANLSYTVVSEF